METALLLILQYKYLILFPLAIIEGPIASLISGFLVLSGKLDFWPTILILLAGDFVPDTIYYYLGKNGRNSRLFKKFESYPILRNLDYVRHLWENHPWKTVFFGKLTHGISVPLMISGGLVKMTYTKFISYAFPITGLQYGAIMLAGYLLGGSYRVAISYIEDFYLVAGVFAVVLILLYVVVIRQAKRAVLKSLL